MFYLNIIDILLLSDKLNLTCFVLYKNKELFTITKMYIITNNILMLIITIAIAIIVIIIIIIITIAAIIISITTVFVKSAWRQTAISFNSCAT